MSPEPLSLKPGLDDAVEHWLAFWEHDLIDRPVIGVTAPLEGAAPAPHPPYLAGTVGEWPQVIEQIEAWLQSVYWGGDSIPLYVPSFGPDQMAAFCGAELVVPEAGSNYGTDWVEAFVDEWEEVLPLRLEEDGFWWRRMLDWYAELRTALAGQAVLAHLDLHSNLDLLLAIRGGEKLCLDLALEPELMDRVVANANTLYQPIYQGVYDSGQMQKCGVTGWLAAYHPVRTNTIQCDFAALIGPRQFDRYVAPSLEQEAAFLGHTVYHLDGPECLVHLDTICSIPGIDCIQWVHGARNKPFREWIDLLQTIQSKGVAVWVSCGVDELAYYHERLDPRLVWYDCWAPSQKAADQAVEWLTMNT